MDASDASTSKVGALDGIRVVAVEHFISGPFCSQILADQGADVIKVEPPRAELRNGYFHNLNRNKRSVQLDLKTAEGLDQLRAIARTADVLVTNMGADVPARLGYSYEELRELNPQLVYVHITGFGVDSPYKSRPAFDGVIQAMSGMMHLTGEPDGPPMLSGLFVPDHLTGLYAALAVSFGLQRRDRTGEGSFVDLAMLDCLMSFLAGTFHEVLEMGISPNRIGSRVRGSFASTYRSADGYIYLCPLTGRMWEGVAEVVGRPDFLEYFPQDTRDDRRLEAGNRALLDEGIEAWTSTRTVAEAVEAFAGAGVAVSPIYTIEDVVNDPNVAHRHMVRQVPYHDGSGNVFVAGSPLPVVSDTFDRPAPGPGQHTDEILREVGWVSATR